MYKELCFIFRKFVKIFGELGKYYVYKCAAVCYLIPALGVGITLGVTVGWIDQLKYFGWRLATNGILHLQYYQLTINLKLSLHFSAWFIFPIILHQQSDVLDPQLFIILCIPRSYWNNVHRERFSFRYHHTPSNVQTNGD